MTRVYVSDTQARVSVRAGSLVVLVDGRTQGEWPIETVTGLSCFGPAHFSGQGLAKLLESGVRVDLFSATGRYRGSLSDGRGDSVFVRMAHHDRWRNADYRLRLAQGIVREKIRAQLALLESRAGLDPALKERSRTALARSLERLETTHSVAEVMGVEGIASVAWFEAFAGALLEGIPFGGRSRRPPLDAPNALLSLGYTLLGTEIAGMLETSGLDPGLAFLHGFRFGRLSLAYDLLEEVRQPIIDRWVLTLFNRKQLSLEHFEARSGGVFLKREAFREVLKLYQKHLGRFGEAGGWRDRLEKRTHQLRDAVLDGVALPPVEG